MKTLLEKYFFEAIDRGIPQEETPLFSGNFNGEPLTQTLEKDHPEFQPHEIEELISDMQREVEL